MHGPVADRGLRETAMLVVAFEIREAGEMIDLD
jgi:hypothetical protein